MKSVLLLSGGLDSAANLAFGCAESSGDISESVLALTARYGQRSAEQEVYASKALCEYYGVAHEIVDLGWLGGLGGSALTEAAQAVPEVGTDDLDRSAVTGPSAKAVWVPNRNGVLLNVAAAYAEARGAERVIVGFNSEEAATFPDNSVEYMQRAEAALTLSTATGVRVFSYTAAWDKTRIVKELLQLPRQFPFELVWSCYQGTSGAMRTPCGKCESCRRFERALRQGGVR